MSVENAGDQIVDELTEWVKEAWKGIMAELLDWAKGLLKKYENDFPFLKHFFAIWEKSSDETGQLRDELEGNNEHANEYVWLDWVQGSAEIFANFIDKYTKKFSIPDGMLVKLINKEWSKWNTFTEPVPWSSAFWLGQHTKKTWGYVAENIKKEDGFDIWVFRNTDPETQIYATAYYLSEMAKKDGWEYAMIYYNTWAGIKNISLAKSLEFAAINPAIANKIPWVKVEKKKILKWKELINPQSYFAGAYAYYNDAWYDISNADVIS